MKRFVVMGKSWQVGTQCDRLLEVQFSDAFSLFYGDLGWFLFLLVLYQSSKAFMFNMSLIIEISESQLS